MTKKRLQKLRDRLSSLQCDNLLVEEEHNLYYLTGLSLSSGKILLNAEEAFLLVDGRYFEMCQKKSPIPVLLQISGQNPYAELMKRLRGSTIGFDSDSTSYKTFLEIQKVLPQNFSLLPVDNPIKKSLRIVKDQEEIRLLTAAAELGSKGFDYICSLIKEGITEKKLAAELEIFWIQHGGGLAFEPIIAFGPNSSMPHYRSNNVALKKGDPILIDIGVTLQNYHSDMTRMLYFGQPNSKMSEIHEVIQKAHEAAVSICQPGILIGELDRTAREIISQHGYGEQFTHSLGHGIGLEVHECPFLRSASPYKEMPLEENMVITIEPGIYLPGVGGVRIEDTILITKNGAKSLTNRPKEQRIL